MRRWWAVMSRAVDEAVLEGLTDDERRAVLAAAGRIARPEVVLNNIAMLGVGFFAVVMLTAFGALPFLKMRWPAELLFESAPAVIAIVIGAASLGLIALAAIAASRSIRRRVVMRAIGSHARRAVCIRCGYSLVGLSRLEPADHEPTERRARTAASGRIKLPCPECGLVCPVTRFAGTVARAERA